MSKGMPTKKNFFLYFLNSVYKNTGLIFYQASFTWYLVFFKLHLLPATFSLFMYPFIVDYWAIKRKELKKFPRRNRPLYIFIYIKRKAHGNI